MRQTNASSALGAYKDDPLSYCSEVLGLTLTDGQRQILDALLSPPYRVLAGTGHSVGKTILQAALVNWWFDTRSPGICLTTAPTDRQVKDLLWKEVRVLRTRAALSPAFVGPKIPRLEDAPDHFAHGFTAREATRFQGHHSPGGVLILFDEAEGVDPAFWQSAKSMLDDHSFFLACYNPTSPGSAAHMAEQAADESGSYRRVNLSSLDHPNIEAQLKGLPVPIPGAIMLGQAEEMLREDSLILSPGDPPLPTDVELNGVRYRPGPVAEARVLGRRPSESTTGVWSENLWKRVLTTRTDINPEWPVAVGCDVARYGDDHTVMMVRKGFCILHAETHVKQSTTFVARRLRELCEEYQDEHNSPRRIPCMVDEGGIGGGVIDQNDGYLFVPVNAACKPRKEARYLNVRAELWFTGREAALTGKLDISRLPPAYQGRLKQELMSALYEVMPQTGRIKVLSKDDMKAVLRRSPDVADGFNLTLYPPSVIFS